eukprot:569728-Amphidinium_carterae.1
MVNGSSLKPTCIHETRVHTSCSRHHGGDHGYCTVQANAINISWLRGAFSVKGMPKKLEAAHEVAP